MWDQHFYLIVGDEDLETKPIGSISDVDMTRECNICLPLCVDSICSTTKNIKIIYRKLLLYNYISSVSRNVEFIIHNTKLLLYCFLYFTTCTALSTFYYFVLPQALFTNLFKS